MRLILLTFLGTFLVFTAMSQPSKGRASFVHEKRYFTGNNNLKTSQLNLSTTKQRLDSIFFIKWNQTSSLWVNQNKYKYTYDAKGNSTMLLEYSWNSTTNQWDVAVKIECTFDAIGNATSYIRYGWSSNQWVAYSKEEYTFNANRNYTLLIRSEWSSTTSQWVAKEKNEYTYDANKHLILEMYYEWDTNTNQWSIHGKDEFTYDASGNNTSMIGYTWNSTSSQWNAASWKLESTYNSSGKITSDIEYKWDAPSSQWIADRKNECTYDASGNNTLSLSFYWNSTTSQWDAANWKNECTYDNAYSFSELILPTMEIDYFPYNHMLTQEINSSYNGSSWVYNNKYTLYYSAQNVTGIVEPNKTNGVKIFPNPASNYVTFSVNETSKNLKLDLFDLQGRKLFSQEISNNTPVSIQNFGKGLYLYKLNNNGMIYTGKLQVK